MSVSAAESSAKPVKNQVVDQLIGQIRDVDTHEMIPASVWVREYGSMAEPLVELFQNAQPETVPNSFSVRRDMDEGSLTEADLHASWGKGCSAPGAFNMSRRLEFMDVAGIHDSIIFGSLMSFAGQQFAAEGGAWTELRLGIKLPFEAETYGKLMVRAHNDWCIRTAQLSDRLRPVATILTHSLKEAIAESERVISGGVRAISVPTGEPIEGKAPAHPDNDGLWGLYAKHKVPVLLHIGGEKGFLRKHGEWLNAPLFSSKSNVPTEIPLDPFSFATCSLAGQAYLTNLVLGGVFERVPELRCGIMELGGYWIGPTAENMDTWAGQYVRRFANVLSMKPSEYVHRNVRVSPFSFEPVDQYMGRFPYLKDVYCFSSDYPHFEGGIDPIHSMAARVEPLGSDVVKKFFVTNSEWVMPR
jgi:predicted TIM-barrel fold metal-dependent hydrolase